MKRALTAGLVTVVIGIVGATIWSVASTVADGVTVVRSYDAHCSAPSDVVFLHGSCAPPLRAQDFVAGRATLEVTVTRVADGARLLDYTYENRTSRLRSLDWARVELTTPDGSRFTCAGDDTRQRYPAPPSTRKVSGYGCAEVGPSGRYVLSYDGVEAAHLDIRSSSHGGGVRANA